jgi:protein SCO1/2
MPTDSSGLTGTVPVPPVTRPALTLRATDGRLFDLQRRPERELTVLFFGYTHCPDMCPTTVADLAAARRLLPAPVRDRLRVLFVKEDPERDTPAVLRQWLVQFDAAFVGLFGGARTVAALGALHLPHTVLAANRGTGAAGPTGRGRAQRDRLGLRLWRDPALHRRGHASAVRHRPSQARRDLTRDPRLGACRTCTL